MVFGIQSSKDISKISRTSFAFHVIMMTTEIYSARNKKEKMWKCLHHATNTFAMFYFI